MIDNEATWENAPRCGRGPHRIDVMSGVEATTRVVAGLWVLVLAVVAFPVSPFLAAGVIGGAVSALIEHAYRG